MEFRKGRQAGMPIPQEKNENGDGVDDSWSERRASGEENFGARTGGGFLSTDRIAESGPECVPGAFAGACAETSGSNRRAGGRRKAVAALGGRPCGDQRRNQHARHKDDVRLENPRKLRSAI